MLAAHAAGAAELAAVVAAGGWQDAAPTVKVGKGGRGRIVGLYLAATTAAAVAAGGDRTPRR